jgi:SWI/SNF-related matrix-associated actin-dependent regulator of chromatin subfamily A-like protein 1
VAPGSSVSDRTLRGRLLGAITKARQRLAGAKVPATLDLVTSAVEQGEKVIVFSCFEEPLQRLADGFAGSAVVLTGKTPANQRQTIVDRFQDDDRIRVFVANIIAGGVGLNLTAASQVVFNDLDWVPANHWQAEDRAYRIGQTRTVNVTYMIAGRTLDDFVQSVLETKAALVTAVVDGRAMAPELSGDVLEELQRAVRAVTADWPESPGEGADDDLVDRLLARAHRELEDSRTADRGLPVRTPEETEALKRALQALARALSGTSVERYRIASASHAGVEYELTVDGADVFCNCPAFEYRGQCRHARDLKASVAAGKPAPAGYNRTDA